MDEINDRVIIMGDLNLHVDVHSCVEHVVGTFNVGHKNSEGERLLDFCVVNNLAIMNSFFKHKDEQKWSWY